MSFSPKRKELALFGHAHEQTDDKMIELSALFTFDSFAKLQDWFIYQWENDTNSLIYMSP